MKGPVGSPVSYAEKATAEQANAEKMKTKEQAKTSQVDDTAKFEKAVEASVTRIVNSVINNMMANLIRICGDFLPEEIKNNPMVLLQPPPSAVSETAVTPVKTVVPETPKNPKRTIDADESPPKPESGRPKQGGRGKNPEQRTKKAKPNTRGQEPVFNTPQADGSDTVPPAAEAMEVPVELPGGMPVGNDDRMDRFRDMFRASKAMSQQVSVSGENIVISGKSKQVEDPKGTSQGKNMTSGFF
jgi:hypothetical protein